MFRRRRRDTLDELLTLEPVGLRFAFAGVERLFFNRSSSFFTQRRTEDQHWQEHDMLISRADPCPKIVGKCSSHPLLSRPLHQASSV